MSDISEKSPIQEEIARRAYEIYLDRGSENGRDVDDWLAPRKTCWNSIPPPYRERER